MSYSVFVSAAPPERVSGIVMEADGLQAQQLQQQPQASTQPHSAPPQMNLSMDASPVDIRLPSVYQQRRVAYKLLVWLGLAVFFCTLVMFYTLDTVLVNEAYLSTCYYGTCVWYHYVYVQVRRASSELEASTPLATSLTTALDPTTLRTSHSTYILNPPELQRARRMGYGVVCCCLAFLCATCGMLRLLGSQRRRAREMAIAAATATTDGSAEEDAVTVDRAKESAIEGHKRQALALLAFLASAISFILSIVSMVAIHSTDTIIASVSVATEQAYKDTVRSVTHGKFLQGGYKFWHVLQLLLLLAIMVLLGMPYYSGILRRKDEEEEEKEAVLMVDAPLIVAAVAAVTTVPPTMDSMRA